MNRNELYATETTGRLVEEVTNLSVHKFLSGRLGGGQQLCSMIEMNQIDMIIFYGIRITAHMKTREKRLICSGCAICIIFPLRLILQQLS